MEINKLFIVFIKKNKTKTSTKFSLPKKVRNATIFNKFHIKKKKKKKT